jgi:hypothetical protein
MGCKRCSADPRHSERAEAAAMLVSGDEKSGSWRQKLEIVDSLIGAGGRTDSDALAYSAVYLAWIGSGAIRCVEDGGHHRPCRHAELARSIFIAVDNLQVPSTHTQPSRLAEFRVASAAALVGLIRQH